MPILFIVLLASPIDAELQRLVGQTYSLDDSGYIIDDIAGEGRPLVGIVDQVGRNLWLCSAGKPSRLRGRLAHPRIAGPGYKVWVIGSRRGVDIRVRRIGILAPPPKLDRGAKGAAPTPQETKVTVPCRDIDLFLPSRAGRPVNRS